MANIKEYDIHIAYYFTQYMGIRFNNNRSLQETSSISINKTNEWITHNYGQSIIPSNDYKSDANNFYGLLEKTLLS